MNATARRFDVTCLDNFRCKASSTVVDCKLNWPTKNLLNKSYQHCKSRYFNTSVLFLPICGICSTPKYLIANFAFFHEGLPTPNRLFLEAVFAVSWLYVVKTAKLGCFLIPGALNLQIHYRIVQYRCEITKIQEFFVVKKWKNKWNLDTKFIERCR